MADMKEYIVFTECTDDIYLVSAKNAKDAIAQVWEEVQVDNQAYIAKGREPIYKKELFARSTGSLHNEQGKVVMLF